MKSGIVICYNILINLLAYLLTYLLSLHYFFCIDTAHLEACAATLSTGADLGVTRVTSHPPGAAAYFMLLLCAWLKLLRCRFVPLLEPNPGDATAPTGYVQLLYRPDSSQWPIKHSKARVPKVTPSKKILEPPMVETQNHCGLVSTSCRRFSSRSVEHVTGQSVADSLLWSVTVTRRHSTW